MSFRKLSISYSSAVSVSDNSVTAITWLLFHRSHGKRMRAVPSHPMGNFPSDSHDNPIPMNKPDYSVEWSWCFPVHAAVHFSNKSSIFDAEVSQSDWFYHFVGLNTSQRKYYPVKVVFVKAEVKNPSLLFFQKTSKNRSWSFFSFSNVNFNAECIKLRTSRKEVHSSSDLKWQKCHPHNLEVWVHCHTIHPHQFELFPPTEH